VTTPRQPRKVGEIIDGLNIVADLEPGELVESALVLLKVVDQNDGEVALVLASGNLSWIDQMGFLACADAIIRQEGFQQADDA